MSVAIITGIVAGAMHVISGPDHLAAVAPLATEGSATRRALRTGAAWGAGHSTGTWSLALLTFALRGLFDVHRVSHWGERVVGVVLIGIGLWGLHRLFISPRLSGEVHAHEHEVPRSLLAAFGVGVLHGVAGTSHLVAMLPALAFEWSAALAYVIAYGVAGIATMSAFAWGLGTVLTRVPASRERLRTGLRGALSFVAVGVGVFWIFTA